MAVPAVAVSPIVAALDQADLPPLDPGDRAGTAGVAVSLVEAFERVPDPRQARGIAMAWRRCWYSRRAR
jgi:hypothetical protein